MSSTRSKTNSQQTSEGPVQSGEQPGQSNESTSTQEQRQKSTMKSDLDGINKSDRLIDWENQHYFEYPPTVVLTDVTMNGMPKCVTSAESGFSESDDIEISDIPNNSGSTLSPKITSPRANSPNRSPLSPPFIEKVKGEDTRALVNLLAELNRLGTTGRDSADLNFSSGYGIGPGGVNRPPRSSLILLEDSSSEHNARFDRWSVSSVSSDSQIKAQMSTTNHYLSPCPTSVAASRSAEKIVLACRARHRCYPPGGGIVRNSRSQEAYFNSGDNMTCIDIDLDDNMASSVDALHYDTTSSAASLDSTGSVKTVGAYDWSNDHIDMVGLPEDEPGEIACLLGSIPVTPAEDKTKITARSYKNGFCNANALPVCETGTAHAQTIDAINDASSKSAISNFIEPVKQSSNIANNIMNKSTSLYYNERPVAESLCRSDSAQPEKLIHSFNKISRLDRSQQPGFASNIDEPEMNRLFDNIVSLTTGNKISDAEKSNAIKNSEASNSSTCKSESKDENKFKHIIVNTTNERHFADTIMSRGKIADAVLGTERKNPECLLNEGESCAEEDEDEDASSFEYEAFNCPTYVSREIDRPSAARLAKRLFFLHGFKKVDVTRHLSKKNSFSQLVGEEYLKYFDFTDELLPAALRRFIKQLVLSADTQDREKLLAHFASRYYSCNPQLYKSPDSCHTLACAMVLLNNDLHCQNTGRQMTLSEFITNLADMNDGEHFSRDVLKMLYLAIKNQQLEFESSTEETGIGNGSIKTPAISPQTSATNKSRSNTAAAARFNLAALMGEPNHGVDYKKGYIMRKCCVEPEGRKTPLGKRGWKMFYATLRDMVLYLHNDEHSLKRNLGHCGNTVSIHHSLAIVATDYTKKNHVFRLQTADMAQYLVQTSDNRECLEWIDAINFVAASFSAPCEPGTHDSRKHFQRHLLPSAYSKLNITDQLTQHETMIIESDHELIEHRKNPPEKGARSRLIHHYVVKENYLKFELKRYKTYCRLLQYKISAFSELEPSLAEMTIGEVDEPLSSSVVSNAHDSENVPVSFSIGAADRVTRSSSAYALRRNTLERYAGRNSSALPPSPSHIVKTAPTSAYNS